MVAKGFKPERDYETLCEWWKAWGHPVVSLGDLASTGFTIFENSLPDAKPVLVGFMILTNAAFVLIETVCANPKTSPEEREEAVKELVEAVAIHAAELKFKRVLAFPQNVNLMAKGVAAGMQINPKFCYLLSMEVN